MVLDRETDYQWKTFHLFAGAGGEILADLLLGHIPIGAIEIETYPREVLLARQADGILPWFPIWDDVRSFRSKNPATREYFGYLRSIRDELCISGGFPCQDISCAGRGTGISGDRSGLWADMFRVVRKIRPARVFVENSPMLTGRGLNRVLGDLAEIGYNAVWCVLGADDCGAPHQRKRIWIMAYPQKIRINGINRNNNEKKEKNRNRTNKFDSSCSNVAYPDRDRRNKNHRWKEETRGNEFTGKSNEISDTYRKRLEIREGKPRDDESQQPATFGIRSIRWWDEDPADIPNSRILPGEQQRNTRGEGTFEPRLGRMVDGVPNRVDRLKAIGNGQVPSVAATAWTTLDRYIGR